MEVFADGARAYLENMNGYCDYYVFNCDGIIAGGWRLTFLPNIFILFLALAFLEDSGYMARVAYVMDGIMGKVGLFEEPLYRCFSDSDVPFLLLWLLAP